MVARLLYYLLPATSKQIATKYSCTQNHEHKVIQTCLQIFLLSFHTLSLPFLIQLRLAPNLAVLCVSYHHCTAPHTEPNILTQPTKCCRHFYQGMHCFLGAFASCVSSNISAHSKGALCSNLLLCIMSCGIKV